MRCGEYKEDRKIEGGVGTASCRFSTAAGTNEDNYPSNNISLSEGMEGKDKCLCVCVCGWLQRVCARVHGWTCTCLSFYLTCGLSLIP